MTRPERAVLAAPPRAVDGSGVPGSPEATSTPGRRQLNRNRLRHNVNATAWQLVKERGYDDVTVEEIAGGAGISVATFYRHFAGKDDVVTRRWLSAERYGYLVDAVDVDADLAHVVETLFSAYAAAVDGYDVSLMTRLRTIHLDSGLRLAMARGREQDVQTLAGLFARQVGAGAERHPMQLAAAVTVTARATTMSHWAALDGVEPLSELLTACARGLAPTLTECEAMAREETG